MPLRINALENMTQTLLARINALEQTNVAHKAIKCRSSTTRTIVVKSRTMGLRANTLQNALIAQKKKILAERKSQIQRAKHNVKSTNKRTLFQQELIARVRQPMLKEAWHILKMRKVEDPHAAALRKLRHAILKKKAKLKRVPSPDCQTVIVLD